MDRFQKGDTVRLKGDQSSLIRAVLGEDKEGKIICEWVENGTTQRGSFEQSILIREPVVAGPPYPVTVSNFPGKPHI